MPEPPATQQAEIAGGRGPDTGPSPPRAERGYGGVGVGGINKAMPLSRSPFSPTVTVADTCQQQRRGQRRGQQSNSAWCPPPPAAGPGRATSGRREVILSAIAADSFVAAREGGLGGSSSNEVAAADLASSTFFLPESARSSFVAAGSGSGSGAASRYSSSNWPDDPDWPVNQQIELRLRPRRGESPALSDEDEDEEQNEDDYSTIASQRTITHNQLEDPETTATAIATTISAAEMRSTETDDTSSSSSRFGGPAIERNFGGTYHHQHHRPRTTEDCGASSTTATTSLFHLDGPTAHPMPTRQPRAAAATVVHQTTLRSASPTSSRMMFSGLMPPTPVTADGRPSSSQSHLTYGQQTNDPGRISSESAMTVLQRQQQSRESPPPPASSSRSRRLEPRWRKKRQQQQARSKGRQDDNDGTDKGASATVVDVTASMTREEFEALPPAIRRKYFTILERHRFTEQPLQQPPQQQQTIVDSDISGTSKPAAVAASPNKRPREQRLPAKPPTDLRRDRPKRRSSRRASFYLDLPDKIRRQHLTTEEQVVVSKLRRQNINVDRLSPISDIFLQVAAANKPPRSPEALRPRTMESSIKPADSFYDSFRWLEEDKELDLKLHLDDYHANLRQDLPPATESRRPSFRRTMSITKLPFGRSSMSSSRPGTTQTTSSPVLPRYTPTSPTAPTLPSYTATGRRSRALSWMSSSRQNQMSSNTNTYAKHSAAPSPIFPKVANSFAANSENIRPNYELEASAVSRNDDQTASTGDEDRLRTFLSDDKSSIYSDEEGDASTDHHLHSPLSPTFAGGPGEKYRPLRLDDDAAAAAPAPFASSKPSGEFPSGGAPSARDVTVRMTLTRPDLRAKDEELYGWQARRRRTLLEDYDPITCAREGNTKESIERQLAAMDQWHAQVGDRGKMKRLWHKVRGT